MVLARWTPRPLHGWRRLVLIAFGAKLGRGVRVYPSARAWYPPNLSMGEGATLADGVDCYTMDRIEIGAWAIVSQGAYLCTGTHDVRRADFPLVTKPIVLGSQCWIAARAFVGPGVTVGERAVLAACGVASRDLEADTIYGGNPARALGKREIA